MYIDVTDRRTAGQTDGRTTYCSSSASRVKKETLTLLPTNAMNT